MMSHIARRLRGSRPVVGSSRKMISGRPTRGHGQIQFPAHAARIGRGQLLGRAGQVELLQQAGDHPVSLAGAQPLEIRHQLEVLLAGQQLVDRGELAGDPDGRTDSLSLRRYIVPGDTRRPAVSLDQRGQHVDRGRFPCPVWAEQGKDRTRLDIEIDAAQDDLVLIRLTQPRSRYR
jgi:hypothetical protein